MGASARGMCLQTLVLDFPPLASHPQNWSGYTGVTTAATQDRPRGGPRAPHLGREQRAGAADQCNEIMPFMSSPFSRYVLLAPEHVRSVSPSSLSQKGCKSLGQT